MSRHLLGKPGEYALLAQKAPDSIGWPCSVFKPVESSSLVYFYPGRIAVRVIVTKNFDEPPVTRTPGIGHNYPVIGLLLLACAT